MKEARATSRDLFTLRETLARLEPGAARQANDPPKPEEIFTPPLHAYALDPQRALVVGNRGVGKSFWSAVLTDDAALGKIAVAYPRLRLTQVKAVLGFHEAAGKSDGPAPSAVNLGHLLKGGLKPESIWRGVLLNAVRVEAQLQAPTTLGDLVRWMDVNPEGSESALRAADQYFQTRDKIFLLVFDALDRLGDDWGVITELTEGILRLALDMRGFRAMKAKVFIRTDQSKDDSLFRFADASKIRTDAVKLTWRRTELFGLMYNYFRQEISCSASLARLYGAEILSDFDFDLLEKEETVQQQLFYRLAGEFMGASAKQGRTYTWLHDHLADTFGETSPRSFITALRTAAMHTPLPQTTVIDYQGIRAGVQDASGVRVEQLKEDYDWIEIAMKALSGLQVPCDPSTFIARWKEIGTVAALRKGAEVEARRMPLEVSKAAGIAEDGLLDALSNIGVVEYRTNIRINMPDIFRVAAGIKRRGGVRPPSARGD